MLRFFLKKSFLICVLLLLNTPAVFAAPSFWNACKRFLSLKGSQTLVSSETVAQRDNKDTLKILLIRHASTSGEMSMDTNKILEIEKEQSLLHPVPLSKEGAKRFDKQCANLNSHSFDLLIHSPTMRTWQTAQIFLKYFPIEKVEQIDEEFSGSGGEDYDYDEFFNRVKAHQAKSVVLVHHQPFLNVFLRKARGFGFNMNKGSMILLEFPYPYTPGSAQIVKVSSE